MERANPIRTRLAVSGALCLLMVGIETAAEELDIADSPVFLADVKPPVVVMLDNSGSMKFPMYEDAFDPDRQYYGLFSPGQNYLYDPAVPVNADAYDVAVDETRTGAFRASDCALPPEPDVRCWSGSYLNWLTTRRIDATRKVLVGGKTESNEPYAGYGGAYRFKLMGNNEFADRDLFEKSSPISASVSPVPNDLTVRMVSPAHEFGVSQLERYDPHAKIVYGSDGAVRNTNGVTVGEFGRREASAEVSMPDTGSLTEESWVGVEFLREYIDPVVVAKSISYNGGNPALLRIRNVNSRGFEMSLQEWEYLDGQHANESVTWMVMERGQHQLSTGLRVVAGRVRTNRDIRSGACSNRRDTMDRVSLPAGAFGSTPTVITAVSTYNGNQAVVTRVDNVSSGGFDVALQEEEAEGPHTFEDIDYIAFQRGRGVDGSGSIMEVGVAPSINDSGGDIVFDAAFDRPPMLMTDMQTVRGIDTATLRQESVTASDARVFVEEERSCDGESNHANEDIGYVALSPDAAPNMALVVPDRPSGLLQEISEDLRLGISFYRFDPRARNMYSGYTGHGGTMQFQIPYNPFVREPSASAEPGASHVPGFYPVDGYVGAPIEDLVLAVQRHPLVWGTTPLAENLWEVLNYFRQETPYYDVEDPMAGARSDFELADGQSPARDPFYDPEFDGKPYCARPSTIIFTDGEPVRDAYLPRTVFDYDGDGASGDEVAYGEDDAGGDNLDDVAYWGRCDRAGGDCGPEDDGTRDLRPDIPGIQSMTTHAVGFSEGASADGTVPQILQDAADNGGGIALFAEDGFALESALRQAFQSTLERASDSSVAASSGTLQTDTLLYVATYDSTDWSGDVEAFSISTAGEVARSPDWRASDSVPGVAARDIYTFSGEEAVEFRYGAIDVEDRAYFDDEEGRAQIAYLRGRRNNELSEGGEFRNRDGVIGDIVHSSPTYVAAPSRRIRPDDLEGDGNRYSDFREAQEGRQAVVYAGANDGMLHAFNAETGRELFAYVPGVLLPRLPALTDPDYTHQYFVDGTPTVTDAFFGGRWRTVLVGGLRAGGQGIYALDVTNPTGFDEDNVLWEFDDGDDPDLGYTFSEPNIVRLASGEWAAVFGNGYNNTEFDGDDTTSENGEAVLYIVSLADGELIARIGTGVGADDDPTGENRPNGLATVAPVDLNGDSIVDHVYAGDLFGNLWRFDLDDERVNRWEVGNAARPLFTAECEDEGVDCAGRQPITSRPQIGDHPSGRDVLVYFGTGKRFEVGDRTPRGGFTQSFYAIRDNPETNHPTYDREDLLQQQILEEEEILQIEFREVSDRVPDWSEDKGWFMDLVNTGAPVLDNKGEQQTSDSILRNGAIIFTTQVPSEDICEPGGSSWIMELDASTGGRLDRTPFDVNQDGTYGLDDALRTEDAEEEGNDEVPVYVGGTRDPLRGVLGNVTILTRDEKNDELKVAPGEGGKPDTTAENPGSTATGRRSWQEVR